MKKSFLERIQPSRQRWKLVDWPFPIEGDRERLKLRVLGENELEAAHLATVDHFKTRKPVVVESSSAFKAREQIEIVWRAFSSKPEDMADAEFGKSAKPGDPIADDSDGMALEPKAIIDELFTTYVQFQADVATAPYTAEDMEALIELLKKNTGTDLLYALPSSWLNELCRTLASRLPTSTQASELG